MHLDPGIGRELQNGTAGALSFVRTNKAGLLPHESFYAWNLFMFLSRHERVSSENIRNSDIDGAVGQVLGIVTKLKCWFYNVLQVEDDSSIF